MKTFPSISGACIAVRPSSKRSDSSEAPSSSKSNSRPISDFFFVRLIFFWIDINDIKDLRRLSISRGESFLAWSNAPAPSLIRIAKGAHPIELRFFHETAKLFEFFFCLTRKSDNDEVRKVTPGITRRIFSMERRNKSVPPPRFIRFRTVADACCNGTSM